MLGLIMYVIHARVEGSARVLASEASSCFATIANDAVAMQKRTIGSSAGIASGERRMIGATAIVATMPSERRRFRITQWSVAMTTPMAIVVASPITRRED